MKDSLNVNQSDSVVEASRQSQDLSQTLYSLPRLGWVKWVSAAVLLFSLVWFVPPMLIGSAKISDATRLTLETQMRDVLAKMIWAGVTLGGAWLVWRHLNAMAQVVENSSKALAASERTAFFAAQGAETERYARAMSLLGSDQLEVRMGGVFALERLARESSRDHGPIMEVLSAFVRDHAAWSEGEPVPPRPSADIQAALTVLGRRHVPFDVEGVHLDLHGTAMARAYLPWAHLAGAFLYEANLEGAILQNANLRGAWLWKADLSGAILDGAHLEGADLTGVAGLTAEQLRAAYFNDTTKLPNHLRADLYSPIGRREEEKPTSEDWKLPSRKAEIVSS